MKTKIVLWGENDKDEKLLIGIELIEADNVVRIHTIPENLATEIFYNQMMNQWRNGQEIELPEGAAVVDRPLTMTESLLPDDLKTDRQDILARAKTEWHFIVLSSKLYNSYADEIQEFKEKVEKLTAYDNALWDDLKGFWGKVQEQVREKNIFREHATELRARTNKIFDDLKSLRTAMNDEYEKVSRTHLTTFYEKLDSIEKRIESGLGLQPIFNELKGIQNDFKKVKFTRKHHNDVWNRIDKAFKLVKEKKYGHKEGGDNKRSGALGRIESRYNGLMSAINKMKSSIGRDRQDEAFQLKRINTTDGQLELQIRQAKMAMIQERISSKQVKLDDMLKTKGELETRIESEKKKAAALAAKKIEQAERNKAKAEIKNEIAKEIENNTESFKGDEVKLTKAAETIQAIKAKRKAAAEKTEAPTKKVEETVADAKVDPSPAVEAIATQVIVEEAALKAEVAEAVSIDAPKVESEAVAKEVEKEVEKAVEEVVSNDTPKVETEAIAKEAKVVVEETVATDAPKVEAETTTESPLEVIVSDVSEKVSGAIDAVEDKIETIVDAIEDGTIVETLSDAKDEVIDTIKSILNPDKDA